MEKKMLILKPKKERDCTFSIRIDKELQSAYEQLSLITGYSRNELINLAMTNFLSCVKIDTDNEDTKKLAEEFFTKYRNFKQQD